MRKHHRNSNREPFYKILDQYSSRLIGNKTKKNLKLLDTRSPGHDDKICGNLDRTLEQKVDIRLKTKNI